MNISIRKMLALLAIILSFTVVQAVWARHCDVPVSGIVTEIHIEDNSIDVDGITVYGIPFDYLANKLKITLDVGDYVEVTAHQCPDTGKISACTLEVNNGIEIVNYLPGGRSR